MCIIFCFVIFCVRFCVSFWVSGCDDLDKALSDCLGRSLWGWVRHCVLISVRLCVIISIIHCLINWVRLCVILSVTLCDDSGKASRDYVGTSLSACLRLFVILLVGLLAIFSLCFCQMFWLTVAFYVVTTLCSYLAMIFCLSLILTTSWRRSYMTTLS